MDQRHSNLLSELRYAMDEAFGKSERVMAAIVALHRAGRGVKIAIDTALVDIGVPTAPFPATMGRPHSGALMLDANDMLFLQDLKISIGTGVAER
jgi:hypothetical protein